MTIRSAAALLSLVLCLGGARALPAQTVDGVLLEENGRAPVARVMVALLDSAGRQVAAARTGPDGRFTLSAPVPGTYRVRAERVGRMATLSAPVPLELGAAVPLELLARGEEVRLEGIVAQAGERACTVRPDAQAQVATVWEEARKALSAAEWTRTREPREFTVRSFTRELNPASLTVRREESRTSRTRQVTPFRSVPVAELTERGYVQRERRERVYYAPDAEVLLSDEFLDTHCFRLERSPEKPGMVGLAFEPVRGRRLPDVAGVLWLDERTAELRWLDFEYTRLEGAPRPPDRRAWDAQGQVEPVRWGGRIDFERMPDGTWFVRRYRIRMPVTGATTLSEGGLPSAQARATLMAVKEDGAEVTALRTASQVVIAEQPRAGAVVRGVVHDSTRAARLAGATVFLMGTEHVATTDSAGAFRLEGLPAGRYAISFSHPRADSLILVPAPVEVELVPGREGTVDLSLGRPRRVAAASEQADSAIRLRELRATAAATSRRLTNNGFYQRQRSGAGVSWTRSSSWPAAERACWTASRGCAAPTRAPTPPPTPG